MLLQHHGAAAAQAAGTVGTVVACDQTGIEALPGLATFAASEQYGYEFQVGASDIVACGLRSLPNDSGLETIRLWQTAGQILLASIEVSAIAGEWVSGNITPITLVSGSRYIVTTRRTNGSARSFNYVNNNNMGGVTFNSAISYVQRRSINADSFPTSTFTGIAGLADVMFGVA